MNSEERTMGRCCSIRCLPQMRDRKRLTPGHSSWTRSRMHWRNCHPSNESFLSRTKSKATASKRFQPRPGSASTRYFHESAMRCSICANGCKQSIESYEENWNENGQNCEDIRHGAVCHHLCGRVWRGGDATLELAASQPVWMACY